MGTTTLVIVYILVILLIIMNYFIRISFAARFLIELDTYLDSDRFIEKSAVKRLKDKYAFIYRVSKMAIIRVEIVNDFTTKFENIKKLVDSHNTAFIKNEKIKYKKLLENIDNKVLDNEQQDVCVRDQDATLVIAGAGSGKTLTICGKIKYLLEKGVCPDDLLLISFTNKACDELRSRIKKITNEEIKVLTFHKTALEIIGESRNLKITDDNYSKKLVREIFNDLIKTNLEFQLCFLKEFGLERSELNKTSEVPENLNNEIGSILTISSTANGLFNKNETRIFEKVTNPDIKDLSLITFCCEKVKSEYELKIANILRLLGVNYVYERYYDTTNMDIAKEDEWLKTYRPDFYLPDYDIYIEHFSPYWFRDKEGNIDFNKQQTYKKQIKSKKSAHKRYGTKLICSYSKDFRHNKCDKFIKKLKANKIKFNINFNKILEEIKEKYSELNFVDNLIDSILSFIKLYKNNPSKDFNLMEQTNYLSMVQMIYFKYQQVLKENDMLDFEDIINLANKLLRKQKYLEQYKYIVVDEYQDVSLNKVRMLQELIRINDCKILCVGDDWQSIYRFAGSDINLFTNFGQYIENYEILKIKNTYRNSQELIDIASKFILKNPKQITKTLISKKQIPYPVIIYYISEYEKRYMVNIKKSELSSIKSSEKLKRIENDPRVYALILFLEFSIEKGYKNVLLLARNNFNLYLLQVLPLVMPEFKQIKPIQDDEFKIILLKYKSINLTCMTMHKSKGLEADSVVLWDIKGGVRGVPDTRGDDERLKEVLTELDNISYGEDRRLFYVALTRTKNEVFVISFENQVSSFVDEIEKENAKHIATNLAKCPRCGADMILFKKFNFYGCANYRSNGCTYKIPNASDFIFNQKYP